MYFSRVCALSACAMAFVAAGRVSALEPPETILLWPDAAPGETNTLPPEHNTTTPSDRQIAGRPIIRLGDVSKPSIAVYRPSPGHETSPAVLVCPGGGYSILAMDLEGTEVCEWLNAHGIAAVLLKYRVPKRPGRPGYAAPLQDAQRAMGLVRFHAKEWGIDPNRVGVLGFSAGAHLTATLSANSSTRSYSRVDAADDRDCRPNFQVLVYPGGLYRTNNPQHVPPEAEVSSNTPPTFLVMAADDPVRVDNVLVYASALNQSRVPFELHVYPSGGHGFGLRRSKDRITTWPDRLLGWMEDRGFLGAADL